MRELRIGKKVKEIKEIKRTGEKLMRERILG